MQKLHKTGFPAEYRTNSEFPRKQNELLQEIESMVNGLTIANKFRGSYIAEHLLGIIVCFWIPKASAAHPADEDVNNLSCSSQTSLTA